MIGVATIEVGQTAPLPEAPLVDADGTPRDLRAALALGPVVLGIYKSSCQASKTMFPFLERLHRRFGGDGLSVFGVSQDSATITRSFARRLDLSFPILIEPEGYPVSTAFDIAATPTIFLIRLSVGLEDMADLEADVLTALERVEAAVPAD